MQPRDIQSIYFKKAKEPWRPRSFLCCLVAAIVLVVLLAWVARPLPDLSSFCGISNFAWTDHGVVARAGQPSAASLACLRSKGFGAVVNLREESPGYDEASLAKTLGMDYLLVPIPDDTAPSPAQLTEYMNFLVNQPRSAPVLAHDAAGRGRMGIMDGIYLLWKGWSTAEVFERYIHFGAKLDCDNGGNGQIQALHEIGIWLGRGAAWPEGVDQYGNRWSRCRRPTYMANWDYRTVEFPAQLAVDSGSNGRSKI